MIDLDADYATIETWWHLHGMCAPPKVVLAGAHGIAVVGEAGDLCAGWVYVANKGMVGMVEWAVSNPELKDAKLIRAALGLLYDFLEQFGKTAGCAVFFTSTQANSGLARLLEGRRWKLCPGEPHAHFLKEVG